MSATEKNSSLGQDVLFVLAMLMIAFYPAFESFIFEVFSWIGFVGVIVFSLAGIIIWRNFRKLKFSEIRS